MHCIVIVSLDHFEKEIGQMFSATREGVLTEIWHMAHFWVSYGRCIIPGSPMGQSEELSRRWAG